MFKLRPTCLPQGTCPHPHWAAAAFPSAVVPREARNAMRTKHSRLRVIAATAVMALIGSTAVAMSSSPAAAAGGPNLAAGKPATASSSNSPYNPGNINDGNQATYWESSGTTLPQWAQVDLGSATDVDQVVLKLPAGWGSRTQTLSVQASANGSTFTNLLGSAGDSFDPASSNVVTINFTAASARYVRVNITANTGWAAAQLSELEVHGVTTSSSNLAAGRPTAESGHSDVYPSGNVVDGNQGTYWESVNNAFPQYVQVDLGSAMSVNKVVLK